MPLPAKLLRLWNAHTAQRAFEPVVTITKEGVVLGKSVLAPFCGGQLDIDPERITVLLSAAYAAEIPAAVVESFRHAERCFKRGDVALAQMHLTLCGLQRADMETAQRLFAADWALSNGVSPAQLLKIAGIGKFNPNHLGPGPGGGQFTTADNAGQSGGAGQDVRKPAPSSSWLDRNKDWVLPAALAITAITPGVAEAEGAAALLEGGAAAGEGAAAGGAVSTGATAGTALAVDSLTSATVDSATDAAESERLRELGTDPDTFQFKQGEVDTAKLLEEQVGTLQRSSDNAYDWLDAQGTTYDAVGPAPSQYLDTDSFNEAIDNHLLKQGLDKIVVNMTDFTAEQQTAIQAHIS